MTSVSKRYVVSYNGEIYNHLELRQLIDKHTDSSYKWRGYSDTETFLACVEIFGVVQELNFVRLVILSIAPRVVSLLVWLEVRSGISDFVDFWD